jgi:hypothetical protein
VGKRSNNSAISAWRVSNLSKDADEVMRTVATMALHFT